MFKAPASLARWMLTTIAVQVVMASALPAWAASPDEAARGLIRRLVPAKVGAFVLETIPAENGQDVFEIESRDGKIVIRGSSGVAIASGWNWYLKYYCHCHVSLWGDQLSLPDPLPVVPEKIRRVSPFKHRYYLNFCVFSYSLAWYDWSQWERLIDWMALHGVNMPLSVTGEEAIWRAVYRKLGLTDKQLEEFFVGPAYLPFGWMGCIDGWCGPLPNSWIDSHLELQKKIIARERELGMTPVLQGFTGHVPVALKEVLPEAKFEQLPSWCGFPSTCFVNPQDPLFIRIGKLFIEEQIRQFGTDHLYASDTFIEMKPPTNDPAFLAAMGKSLYEAMRAGDPEAVWIMMGWIFNFDPDFWKPPQAKALFGAVPNDRMILLDLACDGGPVWEKTEAFYGKPWIWSVVQDYGDMVTMHGAMPPIIDNLRKAMTSPQSGKLVGIGMAPEGLGTNPVVNDFLGEMTWRTEVPAISNWIGAHIAARYGCCPAAAEEAWQLLLATVYQTCRVDSAVYMRPQLDLPGGGIIKPQPAPYDNAQLASAWQKLLSCADQIHSDDAYRFDLVHVGRQVLANLALRFYQEATAAYHKKDRQELADAAERFLQLIRDMDELTATRKEFLLGQWIDDAKR